MTKNEKMTILNLLRNETGCGMMLLSTSLDTLIDALKHKPHIEMDTGYVLDMKWKKHSLR